MGILSNLRLGFPNMFFTRILYGVVASLAVFIATWDHADRLGDRIRSKFQYRKGETEFDFIVGSGSTGAVVASRLSENPDWKVLLIEAGGSPHPFTAIPAFSLFMLNYPELDWQHRTVPQKKACFAAVNHSSSWNQGRALGGTGNINFLLHLRGTPKDYNNWANITGDPSWSYQGVLPYFRKSEDFTGLWANQETHGTGGPMSLQLPDYIGLADDFIKAGREIGLPHTDLNGYVSNGGVDAIYYPIKRGQRQAPYRAFLRPARRRPNLVIYKFAHVNKILFRGPQNQAYGVEYTRHGVVRTATARKEVIISTGAILTPKLLMLSGIGPRDHLESHGIPCRINNKNVGANLQDHLSTYLGPFSIENRQTLQIDRDVTASSFINFGLQGKGPLTTSAAQASAFLTSSYAKKKGQGDWADIQIILAGLATHKTFAKDFAHGFYLKEDVMEKYHESSLGKDTFYMIPSVGRPVGRGNILLADSNPESRPIIDPKYLERDEDFLVMLEAVKKSLWLAESSKAFSSLGVKLTSSVFPGCEGVPYRSDAYWECYIRSFSVSLHHIVGTAAMGRKDSPDAVVDPNLRVIGTKGLRVMDASIMPIVPLSNTQAACIMIGEKGADMIKAAWIGGFDSNFDPLTESKTYHNQNHQSHHYDKKTPSSFTDIESEGVGAASQSLEVSSDEKPAYSSSKHPADTSAGFNSLESDSSEFEPIVAMSDPPLVQLPISEEDQNKLAKSLKNHKIISQPAETTEAKAVPSPGMMTQFGKIPEFTPISETSIEIPGVGHLNSVNPNVAINHHHTLQKPQGNRVHLDDGKNFGKHTSHSAADPDNNSLLGLLLKTALLDGGDPEDLLKLTAASAAASSLSSSSSPGISLAKGQNASEGEDSILWKVASYVSPTGVKRLKSISNFVETVANMPSTLVSMSDGGRLISNLNQNVLDKLFADPTTTTERPLAAVMTSGESEAEKIWQRYKAASRGRKINAIMAHHFPDPPLPGTPKGVSPPGPPPLSRPPPASRPPANPFVHPPVGEEIQPVAYFHLQDTTNGHGHDHGHGQEVVEVIEEPLEHQAPRVIHHHSHGGRSRPRPRPRIPHLHHGPGHRQQKHKIPHHPDYFETADYSFSTNGNTNTPGEFAGEPFYFTSAEDIENVQPVKVKGPRSRRPSRGRHYRPGVLSKIFSRPRRW